MIVGNKVTIMLTQEKKWKEEKKRKKQDSENWSNHCLQTTKFIWSITPEAAILFNIIISLIEMEGPFFNLSYIVFN